MNRNDIKYYSKLKQKKYRNSENLFLIEGENLIAECLRSETYSHSLLKIFISNNFPDTNLLMRIKNTSPGIEIIKTDPRNIDSLSETVNSQGIIGIVEKSYERSSGINSDGRLVVVLDSINDPGNLGTILRICYWYKADQVIVSEDSADIYNSKVLRSSQGAIFHLNIRENINPVSYLKESHKNNYKILMTDLKAERYISETDFSENEKYVFVFGNESNGIREVILRNDDYEQVKIKGFSECESLNVAISAGIILDRFRNK